MSSITESPQILISASVVYNWFLNIVQSLKNDFLLNEDEKNIDKRFEKIAKKIIGEKNG